MLFTRSNSNSSLDKECSSSSVYRGADLSCYADELQKRRNSQTLMMRRKVSSWSLPSKTGTGVSRHPSSSIISKQESQLTKSFFIDLLTKTTSNQSDASKLAQLADDVAKLAECSPEVLEDIYASPEAIECLGNTFVSSEDTNISAMGTSCSSDNAMLCTKSLLVLISALFPLCNSDNMETLINCGLSFRIYDLLDSVSIQMSSSLTTAAGNNFDGFCIFSLLINLVITVSKFSSYGRNSLLCGGVHELLIKTAFAAQQQQQMNNQNISVRCCVALQSIFDNSNEKIDCDVVESCLAELVELLSVPFSLAKAAVLEILSSITSQMPSFANTLCGENIHLVVLQYLQSPELVLSGLHLISQLTAADPMSIKQMIENGLVNILLSLISSEYTAEALKILSKLADRNPTSVFPLLPPNFVPAIVQIGVSSPYTIMTQAVLFITIVIDKADQNALDYFIDHEVVELLVEMLTSGQKTALVLKCLQALTKLVHVAECSGKTQILATYLNDTDIFEALSDLGENRLSSVSDVAMDLTGKLISVFQM